ncbi:phage holin family protein [Gloeocapsa sp. PCC 73106]|uniref:phage holin family protein n=1 Tax=Gloeocapsa sp. PCC 73106 TaxID=102232 RepID=UPI0002AC37ED|nr:phage holin family protein [Gloeocapsa sp. PCC 73106]ELR99906.1 hypothetical protein GLO73106DRAFT_00037590 [Gloeocapsa sp. PCC 73106]
MNLLSPNIYLYSFYKQDAEYPEKSNPIWDRTQEILDYFTSNQNLKDKLDFSSPRVLLNSEEYLVFSTQLPNIKGFVQPLTIHDSYAIWLNIGCSENMQLITQDISILPQLNPNQLLVFQETQDIDKQSLFWGQTILISAYLEDQELPNKLKELATTYLKELIGSELSCSHQGEFLSSFIFEYNSRTYHESSPHILVWLLNSKNTDSLFNKYQQKIINLLFYRHKIIKIFQNSRKIYEELEKRYRIYKTEKIFEINDSQLQNIQDKLQRIPKEALGYTYLLNGLKDSQNTIETNLYNYKTILKEIKAQDYRENLEFWEDFSENDCTFFSQQISADLNYYSPVIQLFDRAIAIIRGIVESEQAQLDEKLENTIQAVGGGIAAGISAAGIVATCYPLIEEPWGVISLRSLFHPFIASVGISVMVGIVAGLSVWWVIKKKPD